jgi:monovalent cation:H+ antiporter-2, CPA2 family
VRHLNKKAYIIVRVKHIQDVEEFYKLGADQVLPEKLEVAIDLFNRVLVKRLFPQREINRILTHIRSMSLGEFTEKDTINKPSFLDEFPSLNITALKIDANSVADGKLLADLKLRNKTGVTILAIKRGTEIIEHPTPDVVFHSNDMIYVLGSHEQINMAFDLFFKEI